MSDTLRSKVLRVAAELPPGETRRKLLGTLSKSAAADYNVIGGNWKSQFTVSNFTDKGDHIVLDGLLSLTGVGQEHQWKIKGLVLKDTGNPRQPGWFGKPRTGSDVADALLVLHLRQDRGLWISDLVADERSR